jgi:transposase InsO family protein
MSYAKVSHLFDSVESAQNLTTQWLWVYNNERPHFALGGQLGKNWILLIIPIYAKVSLTIF